MANHKNIYASCYEGENPHYLNPSQQVDPYVLQDNHKAIDRLDLLNQYSNPISQDFLLKLNLKEDSKVLILGCGLGTLEIWMAQKLFPKGHIIALDKSEKFIKVAQQRALSLNVQNIDFICEDVFNIKYNNQFDFAHCRYLLEHLQNPNEAIELILFALKEEGTLMVEEDELSKNFTNPPHVFYQKSLEYGRQLAEILKVNYDIGKDLAWILTNKGTIVIKSQAQPIEIKGSERKLFRLTIEEASPVLISHGILQQADLVSMLNGIKEIEEQDYKIFEMLHQYCVQKIKKISN